MKFLFVLLFTIYLNPLSSYQNSYSQLLNWSTSINIKNKNKSSSNSIETITPVEKTTKKRSKKNKKATRNKKWRSKEKNRKKITDEKNINAFLCILMGLIVLALSIPWIGFIISFAMLPGYFFGGVLGISLLLVSILIFALLFTFTTNSIYAETRKKKYRKENGIKNKKKTLADLKTYAPLKFPEMPERAIRWYIRLKLKEWDLDQELAQLKMKKNKFRKPRKTLELKILRYENTIKKNNNSLTELEQIKE